MENTCFNTPEGTRDRLFAECRNRRSAQSDITGLFKRRGYSEVVTPELEYYDLLIRSGNPLPQESMVKTIDRSGRILVMRPDSTAPIARVASTKLSGSTFPQRLYYNQTIFRSDDAHLGSESEIAQCGIELIGAPGLKGDLEVIAMAIDTLEACGLTDYQIELGHSGFFKALTEGLQLEDETKEGLYHLIERKSFAGLGEFLDSLGDFPQAEVLRHIPLLFGDVSTLNEAEGLTDVPGAMESIEYLRQIHNLLQKSGRGNVVRFDLGLINRMDYYTGVVFKGYVRGAGRDVLAGGRYDNLLGCFGENRPATGFSVYVDDLVSCLPEAQLPVVDTMIHYSANMLGEALAALDSKPGGTAELSPWEDEEDSMSLAREKRAKSLIIISEGRTREVAL